MGNAKRRINNNLLDDVALEMFGSEDAGLQEYDMRVERLLLDLVRPDPIQPRRVLPEGLYNAFHSNRLTPSQALRELVQAAQLTAQQHGRPFSNVLELLGDFDREESVEQPTLSPDEMLLRELVNLAVTIRDDGQVNPLTVVDVSQGVMRQYRIETGERRYWATWLLRDFVPGYEHDGTIPCIVIPAASASAFRQAKENTARSGLPAIALARQAALLLLSVHGYPIHHQPPTNSARPELLRPKQESLGVGRHSHADFLEVRVQDVGPVTRRIHPALHHRDGRRVTERNVLAVRQPVVVAREVEPAADGRPGDAEQRVLQRLGRIARERFAADRHLVGMLPGGVVQRQVDGQGRQPAAEPFLIDEVHDQLFGGIELPREAGGLLEQRVGADAAVQRVDAAAAGQQVAAAAAEQSVGAGAAEQQVPGTAAAERVVAVASIKMRRLADACRDRDRVTAEIAVHHDLPHGRGRDLTQQPAAVHHANPAGRLGDIDDVGALRAEHGQHPRGQIDEAGVGGAGNVAALQRVERGTKTMAHVFFGIAEGRGLPVPVEPSE